MVKEMELLFHFSAFLWDISTKPAATIEDTKGTSSVLTEDLFLERQITRTNVWSKVAQPVKDWIILFFFLLFPPVTQHDPISVRV